MSDAAHGDERDERRTSWAAALDVIEDHLELLRAGLGTPEGPAPDPFPEVPATPVPGVLVDRATRVLVQSRALEADVARELEANVRARQTSGPDSGYESARPYFVDARI